MSPTSLTCLANFAPFCPIGPLLLVNAHDIGEIFEKKLESFQKKKTRHLPRFQETSF